MNRPQAPTPDVAAAGSAPSRQTPSGVGRPPTVLTARDLAAAARTVSADLYDQDDNPDVTDRTDWIAMPSVPWIAAAFELLADLLDPDGAGEA